MFPCVLLPLNPSHSRACGKKQIMSAASENRFSKGNTDLEKNQQESHIYSKSSKVWPLCVNFIFPQHAAHLPYL